MERPPEENGVPAETVMMMRPEIVEHKKRPIRMKFVVPRQPREPLPFFQPQQPLPQAGQTRQLPFALTPLPRPGAIRSDVALAPPTVILGDHPVHRCHADEHRPAWLARSVSASTVREL